MHQFSKISLVLLRPASSSSGLFSSCAQKAAPVISTRSYSDSPNFLNEKDKLQGKRGRGGRSSFNGVVATVFGATGFTGSAVCNRLAKIGTQLIIPYRCDPYFVRHLKVAGDLGQVLFQKFSTIEDEDAIRQAVKYSNVVINLIGRDYHSRNFSFNQANVDAASRIARISKEMGIEKFIHISALNCQNEHEGFINPGGSKFLRSKWDSELAVKKAFPEAVILRPSNIWGNNDRFIRSFVHIIRRTFQFVGLPNEGVDIWKQPVYLGDFAQAVTTVALDSEISGQTFELVGSRRYELCDLVTWFFQSLQKHDVTPIDMKYDPTVLMRAYLNEKLHLSAPYANLTTDTLEREAVIDRTSGLPNLFDLGIEPTKMEERIEWELYPLNTSRKNQELGLFEKATPPKYVEIFT